MPPQHKSDAAPMALGSAAGAVAGTLVGVADLFMAVPWEEFAGAVVPLAVVLVHATVGVLAGAILGAAWMTVGGRITRWLTPRRILVAVAGLVAIVSTVAYLLYARGFELDAVPWELGVPPALFLGLWLVRQLKTWRSHILNKKSRVASPYRGKLIGPGSWSWSSP